ncbi:unnamed protein product [Ilex paraguariensis]|uniref:Uncharacterized protein n=1 Tax=Ilex paraguariensis TaxID=185542 RepID=A0ABC8UM33_9AQUA
MIDDYSTDYCQDCKQNIYDSPMPWIGIYVAAASLVCSVAMAADVINGFRRKKLWFPCKIFTVNAASLTVITVAMKLPVDLSTAMPSATDQLAKLSSTVLMTTVMGHSMTSFASMDDNSILMNITALGILVITIIVNACIEMGTAEIDSSIRAEEIVVLIAMLVLLVTLSFSVLMVPPAKRYLELKYHQKASDEELVGSRQLTVQKLKELVEKYWVMAETGGPQFVMARSVTCTTSGVICLLTALTLAEGVIRMSLYHNLGWTSSNYGRTTKLILVIQSIGVVVGTVAPIFRWFIAIRFNCSNKDNISSQNDFETEEYWIQRLVEWKERPLVMRSMGRKFKTLVQDTKNRLLSFCISVQIAIVVASKVVRLISIFSVIPFLSCFHRGRKLMRKFIPEPDASPNQAISEPNTGTDLDLSNYVLQLEREVKLPKRILENICQEMDRLIQVGKRQQPEKLMELLRKSNSFKGVTEFDSSEVPRIDSGKLPHCWTLPVVTLTSIAIALPNIKEHMVEWLLSSVSKGLLYANLVEEALGSNADLLTIKHAADVVWVGVELKRKWFDEDLQKMSINGKSSKETLWKLAYMAEMSVVEFKRNTTGRLMENPLNWPLKIIAANSMYRISRSMLLDYEGSNNQMDEKLFEQLSVIIADILGACLTNLPCIITRKCYSSAIEKREQSVRQAACLLGETEGILNIIQQHELPRFNADQGAYIDEWRENPSALVSSSNNEIASSGSGEVQVVIE